MHTCAKCGNNFRPFTKFYKVCENCLPKSAKIQLKSKKIERMYIKNQRRMKKNGRKQNNNKDRVQEWALSDD